MSFHPKPGQVVRIHYRKGSPRSVHKFEGCQGVVTCVSRTRGRHGPVNVEVLMVPEDAGFSLIVPRGNLVHVKE